MWFAIAHWTDRLQGLPPYVFRIGCQILHCLSPETWNVCRVMWSQAHAIISYPGDKTVLVCCTVSYTSVPHLHHQSVKQGLLGSSPYVRHTGKVQFHPSSTLTPDRHVNFPPRPIYPRKNASPPLRYALNRMLSGLWGGCECFRREIHFPLREIEPRLFGRRARNLVATSACSLRYTG